MELSSQESVQQESLQETLKTFSCTTEDHHLYAITTTHTTLSNKQQHCLTKTITSYAY